MIKIGYVINYINNNGPSRVVLGLLDNLDKSKFEIHLITLFKGNSDEIVNKLRLSGVYVHECVGLSRFKCLLGSQYNFNKLIDNLNLDVLHTHGLIPDLLSSRLGTQIKRITTIHNNMFEDYVDTYGTIKGKLFIYVHLKALIKLDSCVCCSESVYAVMKEYLHNTTFVRNGIEPVKSGSSLKRSNLDIPDDARVFIFVGSLNNGKNIVWLVKQFVAYHEKNEYLLVLGRGEKEKECKRLGDKHVIFTGFQNDPIAYMNISDVYVSASRSEGFSISVLEALSCGLGLMLSDIRSHREIFEMGKDMYIGERFNEFTFDIKLDRLRSRKFDKCTIKWFHKSNLSAKVMADTYLKFYENKSWGN